MGNMLESDASANSDMENNDNHDKSKQVRTDGDGMECDNSQASVKDVPKSVITLSVNNVGVPLKEDVSSTNSTMQTDFARNVQPKIGIEQVVVSSSDRTKSLISQSSSVNSIVSKEQSTLPRRNRVVGSSPKQLPSREFLIAIKPTKSETKFGDSTGSSSTSYDKFAAAGNGKQKNAKFVPYEPYTCATRQIVSSTSKNHARKASDSSSSVILQSSAPEQKVVEGSIKQDKTQESCFLHPSSPTASNSKEEIIRPSSRTENIPGNGTNMNHHHNHHSTVLLRERLKMSEKEVNELQSENARLKKLLIDSMTGSVPPSFSTLNQNLANGNSHGINESFDNLNDEIEVWRSKFLSSCVLVEQLTRNNQIMNENVSTAADILKDLKNSLPLTGSQYENINAWFRQSKLSTNNSSSEGLLSGSDVSFNDNDLNLSSNHR